MTDQIIIGFLAGGLARRLGGIDKCFIPIANKTILDWQLEKTSQFPNRILNANGDLKRFSQFKLAVIPDIYDGYFGPLCGILSIMKHSQKHYPSAKWLLSCATDVPFIPPNLGERLFEHAATADTNIVMATSNGKRHPVFSLWQLELSERLEKAITNNEIRKIESFTADFNTTYVDFSENPDPFFNINTKQDISYANEIAHTLK